MLACRKGSNQSRALTLSLARASFPFVSPSKPTVPSTPGVWVCCSIPNQTRSRWHLSAGKDEGHQPQAQHSTKWNVSDDADNVFVIRITQWSHLFSNNGHYSLLFPFYSIPYLVSRPTAWCTTNIGRTKLRWKNGTKPHTTTLLVLAMIGCDFTLLVSTVLGGCWCRRQGGQ